MRDGHRAARLRAALAGPGLLLLAAALAACGRGGGSSVSPVPSTCTPSGTTLRLTAHNIAFQPITLCAPAGQALTIAFDNQDSGVPHNVQIFSDADMTRSVFKGDIFSGPETRDYQVPALPAGVYRFRCDVHPQMTGVLVVASA